MHCEKCDSVLKESIWI